jgi:hypothetical protein
LADTIGQAQSSPDGTCVISGAPEASISAVQVTSTGPSYVVPFDGHITEWSVGAFDEPGATATVHLEIWEESGGVYTLLFRSPGQTINGGDGVQTFTLAAPEPVSSGQIIGFGMTGDGVAGCLQETGNPADTVAAIISVEEGSSGTPEDILTGFLVNIAAEVVPADLPDLMVTKLCPAGNSTPPSGFAITVTGVPGSTPIICGQTVLFEDLAVGPITISETITATGTAAFASAIVCGSSGAPGTALTIMAAVGDDMRCFVVNNLESTAAPPISPVPGPGGTVVIGPTTITLPITIANTNSNSNDNAATNTNTTANANTTTNGNSNTQNQTGMQAQTGGQGQAASAPAIAFAVSPNGALGQVGVPEVAAPGIRIIPPSTGEAGLVTDEEAGLRSYVLAAGIVALLGGLVVLTALCR